LVFCDYFENCSTVWPILFFLPLEQVLEVVVVKNFGLVVRRFALAHQHFLYRLLLPHALLVLLGFWLGKEVALLRRLQALFSWTEDCLLVGRVFRRCQVKSVNGKCFGMHCLVFRRVEPDTCLVDSNGRRFIVRQFVLIMKLRPLLMRS
jgi:hypothetical protein